MSLEMVVIFLDLVTECQTVAMSSAQEENIYLKEGCDAVMSRQFVYL